MDYRILTDAFGKPMFLGGIEDGGPVWVAKPNAWVFDEESALLVIKHLSETTLDAESGSLDPGPMNHDSLFRFSLKLEDLFFLKQTGIKLSRQEEIRVADLLKEGCDDDGSYDVGELGSVPEKNWSRVTPYSPSFKNLSGRLTADDIVFGREKDANP